jgi:hypothetical protein
MFISSISFTTVHLLNHPDIKTMVKCLGLTVDDLNNGASLYDRYFSEISRSVDGFPGFGKNEGIARQNGGLGVI